MKDLLKRFEEKKPEIVFEWKDSETEAEGWMVINSLRGGAAGGGTRMRVGLDRHEVESLAKTMEVKFTVSGPPIGGAKSGINFDPNDNRKDGVLHRWYKALMPILKTYYGTGGDLNVDEVLEVIPITESYGLLHPQEGVVKGHLKPNGADKIKLMGQLRVGVTHIVENPEYTPDLKSKYKVADLITGYGVAESVKHFYKIYGGDVKDKRVIVQGWGNVGAAAGYYLSQQGAKIVGIIDRHGGLLNENGFTLDEVRKLVLDRKGNMLHADNILSSSEMNERIWSVPAEVFIPAAASRLITQQQVEMMIAAGMQVISCGANVPFADNQIFFGPISEFADSRLSVIPDFISNCGMARVFAFLMTEGVEVSSDAIFSDCSATIGNALKQVHASNKSTTNISKNAFEIALNKLI